LAQVLAEILQALLGPQRRSLLDSPAVGDHHWQRHTAILGPPPAWNPVAAALFFGRTIGQERHQRLAGQRHVGILKLGEAQITAFGNPTGGMRIDMTAQRRQWAAIGGLAITVEVLQQAVDARFAASISLRLLGVQIAGQQVECVDRSHAMALPHQPGSGTAGQRIERQIAGIGRHHVQRAAGMAFGIGLEVVGRQRRAVQVHLLRIGHVHHQPEAGAGNAIDRLQQSIDARQIRLMSCLYQLMGQTEHRRLGLQRVLERPEAATPGGELRFGLRVLIQLDEAGQ